MDAFSALFKALSSNLPIGIICLLAPALAWLVKDRFQENAKRVADLTAALNAANAAMDELHKARLEDAKQFIPLAEKLSTVVTLLTAARGSNS